MSFDAQWASPAVQLLHDHVDTDQIIPGRFLTTTERAGLGRFLFYDWRYREDGSEKAGFPLNDPSNSSRNILMVGENFGCGSSREHAPWALLDFGFRAVVGLGFADIFRRNSLENGLLPVEIGVEAHGRLLAALEQDPNLPLQIDLDGLALCWGADSTTFPVDAFARQLLLSGKSSFDLLLDHRAAIEEWEKNRPAAYDTRTGAVSWEGREG